MTKKTEPSPLDQRLCFALYSTSQAIIQKYTPLLGAIGLTYPQYLVWLALYHGGELSVGALGDELHLNSGTLTPLLKRMEVAGLVKRARSKDDERVVVVALTGQARGLRENVAEIQRSVACETALLPDDFAKLREDIRRLNSQLRG